MKILIKDVESDIVIAKDIEDMEKGLIGQTITELHILIDELKEMYQDE